MNEICNDIWSYVAAQKLQLEKSRNEQLAHLHKLTEGLNTTNANIQRINGALEAYGTISDKIHAHVGEQQNKLKEEIVTPPQA